MFKDFFVKKMLRARGASPEQAEMLVGLVNKNPALFQQIAAEIEAKVKAGQSQQEAAMAVLLAHQEELRRLIK